MRVASHHCGPAQKVSATTVAWNFGRLTVKSEPDSSGLPGYSEFSKGGPGIPASHWSDARANPWPRFLSEMELDY